MMKHSGAPVRRTTKITRDLMVTVAATGLFGFEVLFGGGRPAVLTACVSLLLSPLVMRVDEARRTGKSVDEAKPDE